MGRQYPVWKINSLPLIEESFYKQFHWVNSKYISLAGQHNLVGLGQIKVTLCNKVTC